MQADIRACLAYASAVLHTQKDYQHPMKFEERTRLTIDKLITCDAEIMSGTPVFKNTRVRRKNLIDYLETGESLDDFLEDFLSVSREQTVQTLKLATEVILTHAYANSSG